MKRCTQCIMPETVPGITFDNDGICSFCQSYQKETYLGQKKLDQIVATAKSRNNKYDCIVPLSGGRDSTYVLYVARAIYDLKVLAVNYDNEFRNPQEINLPKVRTHPLDRQQVGHSSMACHGIPCRPYCFPKCVAVR